MNSGLGVCGWFSPEARQTFDRPATGCAAKNPYFIGMDFQGLS